MHLASAGNPAKKSGPDLRVRKLDLSINEVEVLIGPDGGHCTPDVDPNWCNIATGAGVGMSIASITAVTIT